MPIFYVLNKSIQKTNLARMTEKISLYAIFFKRLPDLFFIMFHKIAIFLFHVRNQKHGICSKWVAPGDFPRNKPHDEARYSYYCLRNSNSIFFKDKRLSQIYSLPESREAV